MWLESYVIPNKGPILSSNRTPYFIIEIYLGPKNHKIFALLDSGASTSFINKEFLKKTKKIFN